jgi:hypothetical protein
MLKNTVSAYAFIQRQKNITDCLKLIFLTCSRRITYIKISIRLLGSPREELGMRLVTPEEGVIEIGPVQASPESRLRRVQVVRNDGADECVLGPML